MGFILLNVLKKVCVYVSRYVRTCTHTSVFIYRQKYLRSLLCRLQTGLEISGLTTRNVCVP